MPIERWDITPDFNISRVLTGLWQVADMEREGKLDTATAARALDAYVTEGFTTFDMADHYGSAEEIAGHLITHHDTGLVQCLTKWVPDPGPISREDVRTAVQTALSRMKTERLDLLQFHTWRYADPSYLDALFYLQELKEEGLVGHLGLTNVDTSHLNLILQSGIDIVSNQVCFSLLDQRAGAKGMLDLCRTKGVTVLAFGTLAGGFLTERWLDQSDPSLDGLATWSQMKYYRFIEEAGGWGAYQKLLRVIHEVADRHGVSMANVACRYILDQPAIGGVIIGARPGVSEHIEDNKRLFEFTLDDSDRSDISDALSELEPVPGDCGDEYRKPPFLTASGDLSHHFEEMPLPYSVQEQGARSIALSGTIWEDLAGYSRAVRHGNRILVSGTTATHGDRVIGGDDPAAQTHFVIDKIEGALLSLGGTLDNVVRTRVYISGMDHWEPVARAHGARFRHVLPANTLVQAGLVGDRYLVEIEAEAIV